MEINQFNIEGLIEFKPKIYEDNRGHFFESYNKQMFSDYGFSWEFVQDNQSFSFKNVLRGLHFQKEPYGQGKLVKVITGKALDIVVDIRKSSSTFGQSIKVVLDSVSNNMLFIPPGFAHGFYALEDCIFQYKCTSPYHKQSEMGIIWNDPTLNIDWDCSAPIVSDKDKELPSFDFIIRHLS